MAACLTCAQKKKARAEHLAKNKGVVTKKTSSGTVKTKKIAGVVYIWK